MTRILETNWWLLELPDEWHAEEDEDTIVISDEDNVSTLEISALRKDSSEVDSAELTEFAADLVGQGYPSSAIKCGDFAGLYFDYTDDDGAWREWIVAYKAVVLFIVYGCDEQHRTFDDQAVDAILSTLQWVDG